MGMGFCNAPASFTTLTKRILNDSGFTNCMAYLEDVKIFSSTILQHLVGLRQIFDLFRPANPKFPSHKYVSAAQQLECFGFIVSQQRSNPISRESSRWSSSRFLRPSKNFSSSLCSFIITESSFPASLTSRDRLTGSWRDAE